jgi:potassium channel subfamily K
MGDTVIKSIEDFSVWAGTLTILPGEVGTKTILKASIDKVTRQRLFKDDSFHMGQPPGFIPYSSENQRKENEQYTNERHAADRLANFVEGTELDIAQEAGERGDALERDIHLYHFVLAKELRNLMKDVSANPPKEYLYREWAWYLKLIGQDENDPELHRKPPVTVNRRRFVSGKHKMVMENVGKADGEEGDLRWSWLGTRSPLMSNKTEAEWLLERLSAALERELTRSRSKDPKVRLQRPPISLADLQMRRNSQNGEGTAANEDIINEEKKEY